MRRTSLILLIFAGLAAWAQQRPRAPKPATSQGQPWRGWDTYQTILWSTRTPASPAEWPARVREAGYLGVPISSESLPGLFHYVANMVPELGFHHSREALYKADFAGYTASGDKRFLIRKPCFDDPAFWDQATPRLTAQATRFAGGRPLLYDLRDEPSIGSFISPMDYCFCPHTLRAFRAWLRTQYRSLAELNAEWDTAFEKWDDVVPLTTYEIKDRERTKPGNFAPWADHRAYMDYSFATAIGRMRSILRAQDPATPVAITGVQAPGAFGGYDLWRLSQVVDSMEPYDQGSGRSIVGSFLPEGAPILATYFGSNDTTLRRTAWTRLLDGDRGAIVWDDDPERVILKSAPGMPITPRGHTLRDILNTIRSAAPQLAPLRRQRDRIAIHYSQASIRAHWMFDSRDDGKTWPKRLASYEVEHSRLIKLRAAYVKAIEDLGLTADFVSYEQIEKGELMRGKYRALVLPGSAAMSAGECARVEEFVRGGGVAVGDEVVSTMDEHCRRVPAGSRDSFRRSVDRRGPTVVAEVLRRAGIEAPVKVSAREIKIWRYAGDGRELIALMQNPSKQPARAQAVRTRVFLPRPANVRDGSRNLGVTREFDVEIGPSTPVLLEIR
jgi:hypothetical protein